MLAAIVLDVLVAVVNSEQITSISFNINQETYFF
jgi:hypothetical protein